MGRELGVGRGGSITRWYDWCRYGSGSNSQAPRQLADKPAKFTAARKSFNFLATDSRPNFTLACYLTLPAHTPTPHLHTPTLTQSSQLAHIILEIRIYKNAIRLTFLKIMAGRRWEEAVGCADKVSPSPLPHPPPPAPPPATGYVRMCIQRRQPILTQWLALLYSPFRLTLRPTVRT